MAIPPKVRIYPTKEQTCFLNRQFGAVPMVYNKALAIISNRYKKLNQRVSTFTLKKLLPIAKRSRKYHGLKKYDSIALQQAVINLDKAFTSFFKKQSRYPPSNLVIIALMYPMVKAILRYQN